MLETFNILISDTDEAFDANIVSTQTYSTSFFGGFSDQTSQAKQKIDSFANLPDGWDYGRGGPIQKLILDAAQAWNTFLSDKFDYTDAFPGDNKITIAAGRKDHYVEVIITIHDGKFIYSVAYDFKGKQQFYPTGLSAEQAVGAVMEVLGAIWKASTLSILENIILTKASLYEMHSQITADHYQSSAPNALLGWAKQYQSVLILGEPMKVGRGLPALPQFSGVSIPMYYLPINA